MKALIDADLFCYSFGNMEELETGGLLPLAITLSLVDANINSIIEKVEATSYKLYLTDSPSNFRNEVATILPYKGHRDSEKPPHHAAIKQHLIDNWDAEVCYGIEADDSLGIEQCYDNRECVFGTEDAGNTIICSRDKDLDMIPGWHYVWECGKQKERKFFVTDNDGLRSFYKQLLTGDSTDNILGLFGVGKAAASVKRVATCTNEKDMFAEVWPEYVKRFGNHAYENMIENARLLWILRTDDEREVMDRLYPLYESYIDEEEESIQEG